MSAVMGFLHSGINQYKFRHKSKDIEANLKWTCDICMPHGPKWLHFNQWRWSYH